MRAWRDGKKNKEWAERTRDHWQAARDKAVGLKNERLADFAAAQVERLDRVIAVYDEIISVASRC